MDIAFLELAHRCGPGIEMSLPTLAAVISFESGFAPLNVSVDGHRIGPAPKSKGEAIAVAVGLMDEGKPVALGLGGLSREQLSQAGLGIVDAFDPCRNLAGLAQLLDRDLATARSQGHSGLSAERAALLQFAGTSSGGSGSGYDVQIAEARAKLGDDLSHLVVRETDPPTALVASSTPRPAELPPFQTTTTAAMAATLTWDVFAGGSTASSILVFNNEEKLK